MTDPAIPTRTIRERLDELYRRLLGMPRAENAEDALRQICQTLEEVEDEFSGVAKRTPPPAPSDFDGRMYCPMDDFVARNEDGGILALTRGHRIEIGASGAVRIVDKITGLVEFAK